MDNFKKDTVKDYTAWDLNCPRFVKVKHRQKLEAIFKRKSIACSRVSASPIKP